MSLPPTCNGLALLDACIYEPANGRWVATVQVDTDEALSDPITLDFEDSAVQFIGAIHRGGVESGRWLGTLVGGTGGLSDSLDAKAYYWAPLQLALDDILSSAGETAASDTTSLLDATRSHWQRVQGTGCDALQVLADELGYRWRVKRDGTVWLGADTYAALEADATLISAWPDQALRLYAPDTAPLVRPGVTYDGWQVDHVTTRLEGGTIRQDIWRAIA
jgi:hypothetical protein